jgi:cytochrome b561
MLKNTQNSYGAVAKSLHWLMAVMIVGMLVVGLIMTGMENTPDKFKLYGLHKATGIVVLILALIRLSWKFANVSPLLPANLHRAEKNMAKLGHAGLYLLMIATPMTGWLMSSAAGYPVSVFGLFVMPDLIAPDKAMLEMFKERHELLAFGIIGLVGLHVCAALMHHFYYKNNVLKRMIKG